MAGFAGMMAGGARGQPASKSAVLFRQDLPNVNLDQWMVTAVEVTYPPGAASPRHRHPGFTVVYVLEGEVRSRVDEEPERTYAVGQMFFEAPGQVHAVSRNASDSKPARILALLFAEKGKPLTVPA